MKTKLLSLALISLFAIFISDCTKEETLPKGSQEELSLSDPGNYQFTGQSPAVNVKKSAHGVTRVLKFHKIEGSFDFDYSAVECAPAPYLSLEGYGVCSHIGKYKVINYGCFDGTSIIWGVVTAANGDEIHTYVQSAVQDESTGIWTYHYVIYEGTGRFEGAYGDVYLMGTIDFENLKYVLEGEGTITY